ncbi:hypothetical protein BJ085DRAFT_24243 [Dimargaris cristalligena]|uniref:Uncharacterized protein n=1 Tax=Dimargaris cristalligena TaxID=215637 RepID=A0A4P9ZPP9_9FUNG|nr:hypothetical protein BJ085DRAFT_24243 [Dimargaris cristalligena]|eukprot:RKP34671.1 hypothetical protein BJ085DRAFT_24243 [Dimargaris cristalligena]
MGYSANIHIWLNTAQTKTLEKAQDICLWQIIGGQDRSSTHVLRHIYGLPSMAHRAQILTAKYCLRVALLPEDSLLTLIQPILRESYLSSTLFLSIPPTQALMKGCHHLIGKDPITYLPATRLERHRLIRWHMGWLPGCYKDCPCGTGHTSRNHLPKYPLIPRPLFNALPPPPTDINPIDFAISSLPTSPRYPCRFWAPLLKILLYIDHIYHPDIILPPEDSDSIWSTTTAAIPLAI